jgi:hypothetical protein
MIEEKRFKYIYFLSVLFRRFAYVLPPIMFTFGLVRFFNSVKSIMGFIGLLGMSIIYFFFFMFLSEFMQLLLSIEKNLVNLNEGSCKKNETIRNEELDKN